MTLVSDIIRDAYRESNLVAINSEPSGAQRQEALRFINRLIPSVLGYEGGENLRTVYYDDTVPVEASNTRLSFNHNAHLALTLPDVSQDGVRFAFIDPLGRLGSYPVTIYGGSNTIEGQPFITLMTANDQRSYLFRADVGDWQKLSAVSENDPWPFPTEFDDMFIISLAFRLNPRYNISSQQESMLMLKRSMKQLRSRYAQTREMPSEISLQDIGSNYFTGSFERGLI